jgi:hypothetical protein
MTPTSFGIMTAPMNVEHADVLRVWEEADGAPEIEHAWLFDHLMPIGGDPDGPVRRRSPRPPGPASVTSSWGWRRPTRRAWPAGWPTS